MRRMLILTAASTLALMSPALAQHAGHQMPAAPAAADPSCPPEHAAMGHCTPAAAKPAADPHAGHAMPAAEAQPDPHAGHDMHGASGQPSADPHAGHAPAQAPADPHAGQVMPPASQPDPHAGHAMPGAAPAGNPPVAPRPPAALEGPEHAADTVYDPKLMAAARRDKLVKEHGGMVAYKGLVDQLEYRAEDGRDGYAWDAEFWYGGDYDKLWLKTEGEGAFGEAVEEAEVQALWSRPIGPFFNVQAGVRYDVRPDPERAHLVVGIEGLAPYWFEVDAAAFLSDEGDLTARLEAEYDQRITNKLILQPRVEFELAAQDVPEIGVGSGLSSVEAGLRLRYEFVPEFAPYVGVEYARKIGDTADFARSHGEDAGGWALMVGLRSWF